MNSTAYTHTPVYSCVLGESRSPPSSSSPHPLTYPNNRKVFQHPIFLQQKFFNFKKKNFDPWKIRVKVLLGSRTSPKSTQLFLVFERFLKCKLPFTLRVPRCFLFPWRRACAHVPQPPLGHIPRVCSQPNFQLINARPVVVRINIGVLLSPDFTKRHFVTAKLLGISVSIYFSLVVHCLGARAAPWQQHRCVLKRRLRDSLTIRPPPRPNNP